MSNDATLLQKQSELEEIRKKIKLRKEIVNKARIWEKLDDIVRHLGKYSAWGGGEYNYNSSNIYIHHIPDQSYYDVRLGHEGERVFSCKRSFKGFWEVFLYIPGDWERQISELHEKSTIEKQKHEVVNVQNEIDRLKQEWRV